MRLMSSLFGQVVYLVQWLGRLPNSIYNWMASFMYKRFHREANVEVNSKVNSKVNIVGSPIPLEGQMLIELTGVGYIGYLTELITAKKAKTYLEVGTNFGDSLAPVSCASIAIDPQFKLTMDVVGEKELCLMYQLTSDEFFAKHDPSSLLNGPIDAAFLDGMHLYEFALRDFINVEKYCHKNSLIILHDCIPPNFEMTNRDGKPAMLNPAYENYWTGDVWKTMSIISNNRPDLKIAYIDCPPSGLVVITNCDSTSTVLADNYDKMVQEFSQLDNDIERLKRYLASITLIPSQEIKADEIEAKLRMKLK